MAEIPDRFIFVWSGRRFPYFARLAIESVLLVEPDAEVEVHLFGPEPDDAVHFAAIRRLDRVRVASIDVTRAFDRLEVDPAPLRAIYPRLTTASARCNLLRYALLARRGGVYLDTDVLMIRDLRDLRRHHAFAGEEQVLSIDEGWVAGARSPAMLGPAAAWAAAWAMRRLDTAVGRARLEPLARRLDPHWQITQLNNAVIGARPGARFIRRLLIRAGQVAPAIRYRLGPTLISEVARADASDVTILPPACFYVVPPSYSFRFFEGGDWPLPDQTRLLHVVSSNHRALLDALDPLMVQRRAARGVFYARAAEVAARAVALPRRREAA